MAIGGQERELNEIDYTKKVGVFEGTVVAINPTQKEYKDLLGIELQDDSKATEYLGESRDGNTQLRIDVWFQEVKSKMFLKTTFFLEDKERTNKDETKYQYINQIGTTTWAEDDESLPDWFLTSDYRKAKNGEEELYGFMRTWLAIIDYKKDDADLSMNWKNLMKGNVKELSSQVGGRFCSNVVAMATVISREKDGEVREYQGVYNRAFTSPFAMKYFRLINYNDPSQIEKLKTKKNKELKFHERFVLNISGEYGCRDFYTFTELKDYDPEENFAASDKVLDEESPEY